MFNLLQLFLRLSGFFVFVLLEIICFSLIVKYNQRQSAVYFNSVNLLNGYLQSKAAATSQYFNLSEENERLAKENARLLEHLANAHTTRTLDTVAIDTMVKYTAIPALVIKNSINSHHNYLVLNKGSKDGVLPHSGVVTGTGVVGIVRAVSKHYAVAMSVLHRQIKVSARIRNKNYFGTLVWKSTDNRLFNLEDIPKHAPVVEGDTIETSGYSAIFPPGIKLGTIDKVWMEPGSNYYSIEVHSDMDMSHIQYAYIVKNTYKREQERLEQAVIKEDE
jgi:rod shape-determining protein MreC